MFKCNDCGHLFEEGDEKIWESVIGEYGGADVYIKNSGCPVCRGDYEEITPCEKCGSYHGIEPGEKFCKTCANELIKTFRVYMLTNYTENERKFLEENVSIL